MPIPFTLSPRVQRALARVIERSPTRGLGTRKLLRKMMELDLPHRPPEGLAQRRPARRVLKRPDVPALIHAAPDAPVQAGPLNGASFVVKDTFDVAGLPQGIGTPRSWQLADRDAVLVARVRAAGGRLLGKTVMTELGVDGLGVNLSHGTPHNPHARGYFPGGSSTGTAVAVASGQARFGLGGDGLGSVRIPSGFCGLVGLKPTHGLLDVTGYQQDAPTLDVPGPMAKSASDCALLWQVMAGEEPRALQPLVPTRLGVIRELPPEAAAPSVAQAFAAALRTLGAQPERVSVEGAGRATTLAFLSGAYETSRSPWSEHATEPTPLLVRAFGGSFTESDGAWIREHRKRLREALLRAFDRHGFLASPTSAINAPAMDRRVLRGGLNVPLLQAVGFYTPLANCAGVPGIAVPCGRDSAGRPYSLQILGPPGSETDLLRIALAIEASQQG